jgi:hypothetical protein
VINMGYYAKISYVLHDYFLILINHSLLNNDIILMNS